METFWDIPNFIAADGKSLDITATVCYFLEGRKLKLSIQVENHSGFTISQVLFPMLSGFADKGKTMRMYAPEQAFLTQDRIWDPFDTGNKNHKGWTRNNNRQTSDILSFFPPHGWIIPTKPAESA